MRALTIAGVQRYSLFSPNHVGNDSAVFSAVARYLKENGHSVNIYTEQEFLTDSLQGERHIFTMMRSKAAVRRLQKLEAEGVTAVNSGVGIENCTREKMTTLLLEHQVAHPASLICNTGEGIPVDLLEKKFEPCWVKRADFHAIHREDVTYVHNVEELRDVVVEYALRGIERVVINEHLKGDLIKFYGVAGTGFFYWFYPQEGKHSKFGLEAINGAPHGIPFDVEELKQLCEDAARVLQVHVYGGDCIVSPDSGIRIIDFNDWPSFAPCREEASRAIGESILQVFNNDVL